MMVQTYKLVKLKILFVTNLNHVFIIQNPTTSNGMTSKKKIKDQQSLMCKKYFVKKETKKSYLTIANTHFI